MIKVGDTITLAWDMVTPAATGNSWKKLMLLPSSSMQISESIEEVTINEFMKQFLALNITHTDNDIQNCMSCNGPGSDFFFIIICFFTSFW